VISDIPATAHISFTASSRDNVDAFAAAATRAGGSIYNIPSFKDQSTGKYTAKATDLDGNTIEAVAFDPEPAAMSVYSRPVSTRTTSEHYDEHRRGDPDSIRITVRTDKPDIPLIDRRSSTDHTSAALLGALVGAAAGAAGVAWAYNQSKNSGSAPARPSMPRSALGPVRMIEEAHAVYARAAPLMAYLQDRPANARSVSERAPSEYTRYTTVTSRPRALESPPSPEGSSSSSYRYDPVISEASFATATSSRRNYGQLAIEAPSSRRTSNKAIGYAETPPSPPSSNSSARSHRSRHSERSAPSARSTRPQSVASSSRTITPADFALPASAATSLASARRGPGSAVRSFTSPSIISRGPADYELPESEASASFHSTRQSHSSSHRSRRPSVVSRHTVEGYPLPASRHTSIASRHPHDYRPPESRKTSVMSSYQPDAYPLPASRQTSVVSHKSHGRERARDVSPSGESTASVSTLRPPRSALGLGRKDDDEISLAPSDSVSQASSKKSRSKHRSSHHRRDGHGGSSRGEKSEKESKRSVISLPIRRSTREQRKSRGPATLVGM